MSYRVPSSPISSGTVPTHPISPEHFYPAIDYSDFNQTQEMTDINMNEEQPNTISSSNNFSPKEINQLSNLLAVLRNGPIEAQGYPRGLMHGQNPTIPPRTEFRQGSTSENLNISTGEVMKKDATFEKWNGEALTWTPHYYLLKTQCRVYKPLLVTDEAVCMKIYESIPEPQRQRIRGYWIKCGEKERYNWEEMLKVCHDEYFDQIGAQKAERKPLSMRQGESQIFRNFLLEWELQLEYAGGSEWPDSIKINKLRCALSEKIQDKYAFLDLPINDYQGWVRGISRVAAIMEDSEKFIRKGEAQTTQYATRSGALRNEYLTSSIPLTPHLPGTTDHDGDVVMSGMKIDQHSLATIVARLNVDGKMEKENKNLKSKPAAPWLTKEEIAELIEKRLCLRCKKSGHVARYCKKYGQPNRPANLNSIQNSKWDIEEMKSNSGKE